MARDKDTLVTWLRDAHAMEKATIDNLERLIGNLRDYPDLATRLQQHLEESRQQVQRVEACLKGLGAESSALKDVATRAVGIAQSYAAAATPDEPVKNCIAAHAFENFEIASYLSLAATAEAFGEPEVKRVCEQNLQEERAMASWLEQHIADVTRQYLQR